MPDPELRPLLDNREGATVVGTLQAVLAKARALDIATGFFEVGGLLALGDAWQPLEGIRLVMGDETTRRTRAQILAALREGFNESLERQKEADDSLTPLEGFQAAVAAGRIQARVYPHAKFHAKAYIFQMQPGELSQHALVGSSNFTQAGLTQNLELNLHTTDALHVQALQTWYEDIWAHSDPIRGELLRLLEPHLRAYTPFEVYARALYEYFQGRELSDPEWEENESVIFRELGRYQKDGYRQARAIAELRDGALICDGVGLGKTFIGLMLLEYYLHRGERTLLIMPKSARESVWERHIKRYLWPRYRRAVNDCLTIHNMTDFGREGTVSDDDIAFYRDYYDAIIVDEAHHFRNPGRHRSEALQDLVGGKRKRLYLLTATPINNTLLDLYHLINLFAQDRQDHFRDLGIQNLRGYFGKAEKALEALVAEAEGAPAPDVQTAAVERDVVRTDDLLKEVVVQRSRAYVKELEAESEGAPCFPDRLPPQVVSYSLKRVYPHLYDDLATAFDRDDPLLSLAIYNPEAYRIGEQSGEELNRERQVIGLVRTLLLKRLESSYVAFQASVEGLLHKMGHFTEANAPSMWSKWLKGNSDPWAALEQGCHQRVGMEADEEPEEEDDLPGVRHLDPAKYRVGDLMPHVRDDMDLLLDILTRCRQYLTPDTDDKLARLVKRLNDDLAGHKVAIFTEFRDTARYLHQELRSRCDLKPEQIEEIDSTRDIDREEVIKRFAPYYNCRPEELEEYQKRPLQVLVSTDVLSEGLNLQDANRIVNYDLHWNPVRLMQRIGRVDRRLDPPPAPPEERQVYVYNFLPPKELEQLLHLFRRVSGKTVRISRTLGIEAPFLTPDDDHEALRLFNASYEGAKSAEEELRLELQQIAREHPALYEELGKLPRRLFSGKAAPEGQPVGLFCAYRFPAMEEGVPGELRWYYRRAEDGEVIDGLGEIAKIIRSEPATVRVTRASAEELAAARKEIEAKRVRPRLRDLQAPMGSKPTLVCWMEVCR